MYLTHDNSVTIDRPDDEPIAIPLCCPQCDFYFASKVELGWGCCTLDERTRKSSDLACSKIRVTCPF
jgi:hypothetical protein